MNQITEARHSQVEAVRHFLLEDELIGQKVRDCGGWLHLREWIQTGESRLINANFCKKYLICRWCARRRALRFLGSYAPKVESVMEQNPHLKPVMITLTVKNGEDLAERLWHLKAASKRMVDAARKGKSAKCHHDRIEWNKVVGGLRSIEVSRNPKTGWHPHMHVFALIEDYIDQEKFSAEWERFTGDSFIVGVTLCKNGIMPGLVECVKYTTKFADMDPAQVWEVFKTASGSRLFDPLGALRGVSVPDIDSDSLEGMEGPWRDFIALWRWGRGGFHMTQIPDDNDLPTRPAPPTLGQPQISHCETLSPSHGQEREEPTTPPASRSFDVGKAGRPCDPLNPIQEHAQPLRDCST